MNSNRQISLLYICQCFGCHLYLTPFTQEVKVNFWHFTWRCFFPHCQYVSCKPWSSNISNVADESDSSTHSWPCEPRWPSGMQTGALLIKAGTHAVNFCTCIYQLSSFYLSPSKPRSLTFSLPVSRRGKGDQVCPVRRQQHFYLVKDRLAEERVSRSGNKNVVAPGPKR